MNIARRIVAMHASCTWNYGRGEGEAMRAHLLTVFSPFEHGSGLVFTLFACPPTENGCNGNLKFFLRVLTLLVVFQVRAQ